MAENPQDNLDIQRALADTLKEQLELTRLNNDEIKDIVDNTKLNVDQRKDILKLVKEVDKELSKNSSLVDSLNGKFREEGVIQSNINKTLELRNNLVKEVNTARESGNDKLSRSLSNQAKQLDLTLETLEKEKQLYQELTDSLGLKGKSLSELNDITAEQRTNILSLLQDSSSEIAKNASLIEGLNGKIREEGTIQDNINKTLELRNNLIEEVNSARESGNNSLALSLFNQAKQLDLNLKSFKEEKQIVENITKEFGLGNKALKSLNDLTIEQRTNILNLLQDSSNEIAKNASLAGELNNEFRSENDIQNDINESLRLKTDLIKEAKSARKEGNKALAASLNNQAKQLDNNLNSLEKEKQLYRDLTESLGIKGNALNSLNNLTTEQRTNIINLFKDTNEELAKNISLTGGLNGEFRNTRDIQNDINKSLELRIKLAEETRLATEAGNTELANSLINKANEIENTRQQLLKEKQLAEEMSRNIPPNNQGVNDLSDQTIPEPTQTPNQQTPPNDITSVLLDQLELARLNNDEIRSILSNTNLTADQRRTVLKLLRDINKELSKNASIAEGVINEFRNERDIQKDIDKSIELQNRLYLEGKQARKDGNNELAESLFNQANQIGNNVEALNKEKQAAEELTSKFGLGGKALDKLNKLTGGQLTGLNKVLEASREQIGIEDLKARAAGKTLSTTKGTAIIAKNLGKELFKGKNIYLMLLEAAIQGSNEINKFQKELGIGYGKAVALRNEFTLMSAKSGDLFVNSKKLQEAFFELKSAVGFVFDTSSRASETFLNLSKRLGFSTQEAGNLALLTRLQSKDTEAVTSNLFKAADASAKMYGTTATANDILKSAASASKGLQAALSAAPGALVKAAAAAKAFGVELSALEATQKSLLNFEQSISAELEAELLTGRQLNLEKARLAALNNDIATLGEELKRQNIDLTSFSSMNAIQQEKIAESIGMSRDSLGDALLKQELQSKTLDEINAKFGKQTYEQAKALSAQDRFNALIEKLMSVVGDIGVVLAPVLDLAAAILQLLSPILQIIGGVAGMLGKLTSGIVEGLGIDELNRNIEGGFNNITSVNDMIYGDNMLITKDKGAISLNNEDTIIAGTNLFGGKKAETPKESKPPISNKPKVESPKEIKPIIIDKTKVTPPIDPNSLIKDKTKIELPEGLKSVVTPKSPEEKNQNNDILDLLSNSNILNTDKEQPKNISNPIITPNPTENVSSGISDEQIGRLISGINSKKVVFDSFTSSGPQAFVETERRRPSNLFF